MSDFIENEEAPVEVYIEALQLSLEKKEKVMRELLKFTERQEQLLSAEEPNMDKMEKLFKEKEQELNELRSLDDGFERLYNKIREGIRTRAEEFRPGIEKLQESIRTITELGVTLEALERRNKDRMESVICSSRTKIKTFNKSNAAVTRYYKNMNSGTLENPAFLDTKK